MEPGLIGGEINKLLAGHAKRGGHPIQYKIGPDPSSIDSCMVGGMVANNSSGMCCGVSQNTYHTLRDLRAVFADGSVLDTADPASCDAWVKVRAPGQHQLRHVLRREAETLQTLKHAPHAARPARRVRRRLCPGHRRPGQLRRLGQGARARASNVEGLQPSVYPGALQLLMALHWPSCFRYLFTCMT